MSCFQKLLEWKVLVSMSDAFDDYFFHFIKQLEDDEHERFGLSIAEEVLFDRQVQQMLIDPFWIVYSLLFKGSSFSLALSKIFLTVFNFCLGLLASLPINIDNTCCCSSGEVSLGAFCIAVNSASILNLV